MSSIFKFNFLSPNSMNSQSLHQVRRPLVILSIFMLLLTLTYSSFSMIIIYIHQKLHHLGYGEMNLTANSLTFLFLSFFAPSIIRSSTLTANQWFTICAMGYFINVFLPGLLSTENISQGVEIQPPSLYRTILEVVANIIGGGASTFLWIIYGLFLSYYSPKVSPDLRGYLFSLSSAIINVRVIIGPLLTIFGLGYGNERIFFFILSFFALLAIPYPALFISPIDLNAAHLQQSEETFEESIRQTRESSTCACIKDYLKQAVKMRHFLPISILIGTVSGFAASSLSHLLPHRNQTDIKANDIRLGIALVFFGVGNILGGWICGKVYDKIKSKARVATIGICLLIAASSLEVLVLWRQGYSLLSASGVAFGIGLASSYLLCYMMLTCTNEFNGSGQSFAIDKQGNVISYFFYQWTVRFVNNPANMKDNMIIEQLGIIALAVASIVCVHKYPFLPVSSAQKQVELQTEKEDVEQ